MKTRHQYLVCADVKDISGEVACFIYVRVSPRTKLSKLFNLLYQYTPNVPIDTKWELHVSHCHGRTRWIHKAVYQINAIGNNTFRSISCVGRNYTYKFTLQPQRHTDIES